MDRGLRIQRSLVLITAAIFFCAAGLVGYHASQQLPPWYPISCPCCPNSGVQAAPIEIMIVFDPLCVSCKRFHEQILPELFQRYRDTSLARFRFMPVALLYGSRPAGEALLEVNEQSPDLFLAYLHQIMQQQIDEEAFLATEAELLTLACNLQSINCRKMQQALQSHKHRQQLENNLEQLSSLLRSEVVTPAVFIDGYLASNLSAAALSELTERVLDKKGIL